MNAGAHAGELARVAQLGRRLRPRRAPPRGPRRAGAGVPALGRWPPARWSRRPASPCVRGDADAIAARLAEFRARRRATQPQGVRTFGSVFTNPPGDSAGRLLEAAGCKGLAVGGARFSPVHANFIEAAPGCRSADVLALMAEGRRPRRRRGRPGAPPGGALPGSRARHRPRAGGGAVSRPAPARPGRRAHPALAERRRAVVRARGRRRRSLAVLIVGIAAGRWRSVLAGHRPAAWPCTGWP